LSDDTWLTLATCEAISRDRGRVDPAGQIAGAAGLAAPQDLFSRIARINQVDEAATRFTTQLNCEVER